MDIVAKDNSAKVMFMMQANIQKALTAMGQVIVRLTTDYMRTKYANPVYDTGDLLRSISFHVDAPQKTVVVGSNLNYAPWVHDGTTKMDARPFLKDAIMENKKLIEEVAEEYLGKGFKLSVSFSSD